MADPMNERWVVEVWRTGSKPSAPPRWVPVLAGPWSSASKARRWALEYGDYDVDDENVQEKDVGWRMRAAAATDCPACGGRGSRASDEPYMQMQTEPCSACNGTGKNPTSVEESEDDCQAGSSEDPLPGEPGYEQRQSELREVVRRSRSYDNLSQALGEIRDAPNIDVATCKRIASRVLREQQTGFEIPLDGPGSHRADLAALRAEQKENKRLRDALDEYGDHTNSCPAVPHRNHAHGPCNCGWADFEIDRPDSTPVES